jgi:hypothetical protein
MELTTLGNIPGFHFRQRQSFCWSENFGNRISFSCNE